MDKSRMQRLAGIEKTNQLNESIGGYVDMLPLKEMDDNSNMEGSLTLDWAGEIPELKAKCKKHGVKCKVITMDGPGGGWPEVKIMGNVDALKNWLKDDYAQDDEDLQGWIDSIETGDSDLGEGFGDKLKSVGRFAGDMLGIGKDELIDALYRKFSESDIKYTKYGEQAYSDYLNDRSAARPNFKTYLKTVDNFTIKAIAQELGLDFDDPKNLRREGDEDMEQGDSVTGDEGWEANTLADYFSYSGKDAINIAKKIDSLLRKNYQDDNENDNEDNNIVDLIFDLASAYHDDKVNNPDPTFDEAKEKGYKGMNMSKGDVLNKVGKGDTNTKKGADAKNYVAVHASSKNDSKGKTNESKIKPNKDFIW
jgi:hypothetical protein